ncbi:Copine-8 [Aphelenchoides avenae]|nr:Copine-8 [Aphelenchus avenae]
MTAFHFRQFVIECYDYDRTGGHDFIGKCAMTVNELLSTKSPCYPLVNAKKAAKEGSKYQSSGVLQFAHVLIKRVAPRPAALYPSL